MSSAETVEYGPSPDLALDTSSRRPAKEISAVSELIAPMVETDQLPTTNEAVPRQLSLGRIAGQVANVIELASHAKDVPGNVPGASPWRQPGEPTAGPEPELANLPLSRREQKIAQAFLISASPGQWFDQTSADLSAFSFPGGKTGKLLALNKITAALAEAGMLRIEGKGSNQKYMRDVTGQVPEIPAAVTEVAVVKAVVRKQPRRRQLPKAEPSSATAVISPKLPTFSRHAAEKDPFLAVRQRYHRHTKVSNGLKKDSADCREESPEVPQSSRQRLMSYILEGTAVKEEDLREAEIRKTLQNLAKAPSLENPEVLERYRKLNSLLTLRSEKVSDFLQGLVVSKSAIPAPE